MISKKLISELRMLHQPKHRQEERRFLAEGEKVVLELLRSDYATHLIVALPSFLETHADLLKGMETIAVNEKELERISSLQTPNQVVAMAAMPGHAHGWNHVKEDQVLMLDGIADPGNMGTIIRTAEWFGIKNILCSSHSVSCFNPKVVQGAMGSLFRMNIYYAELTEAINGFRSQGYKIYSASLEGTGIAEMKYQRRNVLVIGSESHGVSPDITKLSDQLIAIPNSPGAATESLNAAVACGIILFAFSGCNKKSRIVVRDGLRSGVR